MRNSLHHPLSMATLHLEGNQRCWSGKVGRVERVFVELPGNLSGSAVAPHAPIAATPEPAQGAAPQGLPFQLNRF